jgi:hypothetical protein
VAPRLAALVAAGTALALAAAPALAASDVRERVSPRKGAPDTVFRVGFTAPAKAGIDGGWVRGYHVELVSGRGTTCTHAVSREVTAAEAGERVRLAFPPRDRWCPGRGRGTIYMHESQYCETEPCPASPAVTRPIARFAFRVRVRG